MAFFKKITSETTHEGQYIVVENIWNTLNPEGPEIWTINMINKIFIISVIPLFSIWQVKRMLW